MTNLALVKLVDLEHVGALDDLRATQPLATRGCAFLDIARDRLHSFCRAGQARCRRGGPCRRAAVLNGAAVSDGLLAVAVLCSLSLGARKC